MTTLSTTLFLAVTVVVALSFDAVQAAAVPWAAARTGNAPQENRKLLTSQVRRSWGSFFYDTPFSDDQFNDEFSEETDEDDDDKRVVCTFVSMKLQTNLLIRLLETA